MLEDLELAKPTFWVALALLPVAGVLVTCSLAAWALVLLEVPVYPPSGTTTFLLGVAAGAEPLGSPNQR